MLPRIVACGGSGSRSRFWQSGGWSRYAAVAAVAAAAAAAELHQPSASRAVSAVTQQAPKKSQYYALDQDRAQLKQLHVVFRHGARTPLTDKSSLWKGVSWDVCGNAYQAVACELRTEDGKPRPINTHDAKQLAEKLEGNCHKGQLTLAGQIQALELGQWLRRRYVKELSFLPEQYKASALQSRSTNFQRTVATLAGVLTGLYPPAADGPLAIPASDGGSQKDRDGSGLVPGTAAGVAGPAAAGPAGSGPVPVVVAEEVAEVLYADTASCPHLGTFFSTAKRVASEALGRNTERKWAEVRLRELLEPVVGPEFFAGKWRWADIHDVFTTLQAHGKPLPASIDDRLLAAIDKLATTEFTSFIAPAAGDEYSNTVIRLSMGRILDIISNNLQRVASGSAASATLTDMSRPGIAGAAPTPAAAIAAATTAADGGGGPLLYLLSGHDSTIMPLLVVLGAPVHTWPEYCSNLVIELWELQQPSTVPGADAAPEGKAPASLPGAASTGVHVVRVLYNKQELPLPGCPAGTVPTLEAFRSLVLGPYTLSEEVRREACFVAGDAAVPSVSLASPQQAEQEAGI